MKNRIIGSLIGLAVGDALGAPYEFRKPPYKVSSNYIEGGAHDVSIGEWTDDTSMALCLAQSLIENSGFNARDQMNKYIDWEENGYFSTRSRCFDIGYTVLSALNRYRQTKDPYSGIEGDENSGNGSLMRLAPISILYYKDNEQLKRYAVLSSQTTHKSKLAVDACVYYAQLIAGAIKGISKNKLLSSDFIDNQNFCNEIKRIISGSYKEKKNYKPTGYVIDTLEVALMAFYRYTSFEEGLLHIVSLGYDTDTVGAVYGQLAGAYYGYEAIPKRWTSLLMKHDMIFDIALNLYKTEIREPIENQSKNNIHIQVGDITTINTDAIVNPTNYSLLGGGGVDGAIHKAGGKNILKECEFLRKNCYPDGLPTGEAVITTAGNLKAKYVVHTVGPQYKFDTNSQEHLRSCYKNSFLLADKYKSKSIAFPSIATGMYAYPKKEAGKIAYDTILSLLPNAKHIKDVIFVFYSKKDADIFHKIIN